MLTRTALLTAAAFLLAGCSTAVPGTPHAAPPPAWATTALIPATTTSVGLFDRIMVTVWRNNAVGDAGRVSDAQVVAAAVAACAALDRHPTRIGLLNTIGELAAGTGWQPRNAAYLVGAAIGDRCPRHAHLLPGS